MNALFKLTFLAPLFLLACSSTAVTSSDDRRVVLDRMEAGASPDASDAGCPSGSGTACVEAPRACVCPDAKLCPPNLDAFLAAHAGQCPLATSWAETIVTGGVTVARLGTTMGNRELVYDNASRALVGARIASDTSCIHFGAPNPVGSGGTCTEACFSSAGASLLAPPRCAGMRDAATD